MNRNRWGRVRSQPFILALGLLVAAACQQDTNPVAPVETEASRLHPSSTATIDPALQDALAGASDTDQLEVLVTFDPGAVSSADLATAVAELGAGVVAFKHLPVIAALATPGETDQIRQIDGVRGIYLNEQLEYHLFESTESIRADLVHEKLGFTGRGIGVAILDSGIDGLYHPDVAYPTRTVQNVKYIASSTDLYADFDDELGGVEPKLGAELFIENLANSETSVGHGTHVAGIAAGDGSASSAGIYEGVAPEANLVGIGAGDILFIFWVLAGFDYVLDNQEEYNIKVVNNSWGSRGSWDPEHPINLATQAVHGAGITVVFSAGNSGPGQDTLNRYSVAPWVIGVAAGCKLVDQDPTGSAVHCEDQRGLGREPVLADFSSRGVPGDPLLHPDIMAPGVHVVSARASTGTVMNTLDLNHDARICNISLQHEAYYTCASGTSMAAPHVAGVVALMQEAAGGTLSPDKVLDILVKSAESIPDYEVWEIGAGEVDAYRAVRRARR
ncbi:MAG: S8 family serine peptidase [Gemmatimonadetes bacterium]|nr:S8 family serine peptidase [Gemmatimonadota bacterium]